MTVRSRGHGVGGEAAATDGGGTRVNAVSRTEERIATAMAYVRCAMAVLALVPLLGWENLRRPWLAAVAAVVAVTEAWWLFRRVRSRRTLVDPVLVLADVGVALMLTAIGAAAAGPSQLNKVMTEILPFGLASAGFVGFGLGSSGTGIVAVGALALTWTAAALPGRSLKLVSDLLGFGLWYLVTLLVGREFREMAGLTEQAQAEVARSQQQAAERAREADVAREREITHREIHEHLLPIVDAVASAKPVSDRLVRLAAREADRARRLIMDGRLGARPGFEALVADVRDTYVDAGLHITSVFRIVADPPSDVGEAVAAAAREAMCNVVKYAGSHQDVNFYVESTEAGVELVVRDRGVGFDPGAMIPGGGFSQTYGAVRRRGGEVVVLSAPGEGTKVSVRWTAGSPTGPGPAQGGT